MKLTLAERMFEGVFDEQSDRNLNQMYNEIKELRTKYNMTFRSLIKTPFIKQMFEMIEEEYAYRNQMMEENNH
jgi:hypothetical protein